MRNAYDFDETIYDGDSSVDFFFFCLHKNKKVLCSFFNQLGGLILYIFKIIDKTKMKEHLFSYLKQMKDIDSVIDEFWKEKGKNIKQWYLDQKLPTDVIISASPEFLLKPLEKKLDVTVIASIVDKKTGRFESKNCHDYEKIKRYEEQFKDKIKEFYTDSIKADKAMLEYAEVGYVVHKNEIEKYQR